MSDAADLDRHLVRPSGKAQDHPIHDAAEHGRVRRVRDMLDADPQLVHDAGRFGASLLHAAVASGSRELVELVLDRGADIHAIHGAPLPYWGVRDMQPIDWAIWGGARFIPPPFWLHTLYRVRWYLFLQWTCDGHTRPCAEHIARLLIARGAMYDVPTAAALGDVDAVRRMLDDDPSRVRETRPNGRLALSSAAEFGHMEIVRLLLERGANPIWPDAHGSERGAALHAAARAGNREMVDLLLQHGADPNGFYDAAGNAVGAAKTREIRKLLMDHGGRLDPYDLAWMGEDDEVMRLVTENPESALAGCGGVYTAVVRNGRRQLMKRLLDAGIRVHPQAGGCHSYLLAQPDMLRELLKRGGLDPDYPTAEGVTLLHELCTKDLHGRTMNHRATCAAILLDGGAQLSPRNATGDTPLDLARRNELPDMVQFLVSRGAT